LSGAQSFVQSGPKVDNGGEGAVAIVHRRVQLLVGHLDRSGLFGGGSTVAWGGSGDLVRLHLVVCGLEVGRHIVGVGAGVSQGAGKRRRERKHRESAAGHEAGGTWAGPKHVGAHHTWQRRGCAGGPDSRTRGTRSSVRIRATRRGGQGREAGRHRRRVAPAGAWRAGFSGHRKRIENDGL
jgi:hypothetical protein